MIFRYGRPSPVFFSGLRRDSSATPSVTATPAVVHPDCRAGFCIPAADTGTGMVGRKPGSPGRISPSPAALAGEDEYNFTSARITACRYRGDGCPYKKGFCCQQTQAGGREENPNKIMYILHYICINGSTPARASATTENPKSARTKNPVEMTLWIARLRSAGSCRSSRTRACESGAGERRKGRSHT
jgi:hypothetical protein